MIHLANDPALAVSQSSGLCHFNSQHQIDQSQGDLKTCEVDLVRSDLDLFWWLERFVHLPCVKRYVGYSSTRSYEWVSECLSQWCSGRSSSWHHPLLFTSQIIGTFANERSQIVIVGDVQYQDGKQIIQQKKSTAAA